MKLNAPIKQYYNFYAEMKLGVAKAKKFINNLEPKISEISVNYTTDLCYINCFTDKKYYIKPEDAKKIDHEIERLMYKYYVEYSDLLYKENYCEGYTNLGLENKYYIPMFAEYSTLDYILGLKVTDKIEKHQIFTSLVIMTLGNINSYEFEVGTMLEILGRELLHYCIILDLDPELSVKFVKRLDKSILDSNKLKTDLFKEVFGRFIENTIAFEYTIIKLIQRSLDSLEETEKNRILSFVNQEQINFQILNTEKQLVKHYVEEYLISQEEVKHFWFTITDTTLYIYSDCLQKEGIKDKYSDLEMPKLNGVKGKRIKINQEKFILTYLDKLNMVRIYERDVKYMDKVYGMDKLLVQNHEFLTRLRIFDHIKVINKFVFDFLDKKPLFIQDIPKKNSDIDFYYYVLDKRLILLNAKRVFFHESIFRHTVMSCFSYFFLKKEVFFDKKKVWMESIPKIKL